MDPKLVVEEVVKEVVKPKKKKVVHKARRSLNGFHRTVYAKKVPKVVEKVVEKVEEKPHAIGYGKKLACTLGNGEKKEAEKAPVLKEEEEFEIVLVSKS